MVSVAHDETSEIPPTHFSFWMLPQNSYPVIGKQSATLYCNSKKQKWWANLIHVYGLQGFSTSKNNGMILIFRFSFTNHCWRTWKLDAVDFLRLEYMRILLRYFFIIIKESISLLNSNNTIVQKAGTLPKKKFITIFGFLPHPTYSLP